MREPASEGGGAVVAYGSAARGHRCLAGALTALNMEFLMGNPFSTPVGQRIGEPSQCRRHTSQTLFSHRFTFAGVITPPTQAVAAKAAPCLFS